MKKMNLLSKAEMKKVMGGDDPVIGEIGGETADCFCPGKSTSACPSGTAACSIKNKKDSGNNTVYYAVCDGKDVSC